MSDPDPKDLPPPFKIEFGEILKALSGMPGPSDAAIIKDIKDILKTVHDALGVPPETVGLKVTAEGITLMSPHSSADQEEFILARLKQALKESHVRWPVITVDGSKFPPP